VYSLQLFQFSSDSPQEEGFGTATPTTAADDDLDFSDLKKKKKKKKAAFDLEAFEKELSESKAKDEEADVDEAGGEPDGRHLDDVNEEDLGEDVFAQSHETPATVDSQNEPWLSSDRDYTYQEVSSETQSLHSVVLTQPAASSTFLRSTSCLEPRPFLLQHQTLHHCPPTNHARRKQENDLRQYSRYLQTNAQTTRARHPIHVR
jgi:hypothetical protein